MTQIKLNANHPKYGEQHREVARLIVNIKNTEDGLKLASVLVGSDVEEIQTMRWILVGVNYLHSFFIITKNKYIGDEPLGVPHYKIDGSTSYDNIQVDLSTAQIDIYACMREGLSVQINFESGELEGYDLSNMDDKQSLLFDIDLEEIQSIKILNLESFNGVEIVR